MIFNNKLINNALFAVCIVASPNALTMEQKVGDTLGEAVKKARFKGEHLLLSIPANIWAADVTEKMRALYPAENNQHLEKEGFKILKDDLTAFFQYREELYDSLRSLARLAQMGNASYRAAIDIVIGSSDFAVKIGNMMSYKLREDIFKTDKMSLNILHNYPRQERYEQIEKYSYMPLIDYINDGDYCSSIGDPEFLKKKIVQSISDFVQIEERIYAEIENEYSIYDYKLIIFRKLVAIANEFDIIGNVDALIIVKTVMEEYFSDFIDTFLDGNITIDKVNKRTYYFSRSVTGFESLIYEIFNSFSSQREGKIVVFPDMNLLQKYYNFIEMCLQNIEDSTEYERFRQNIITYEYQEKFTGCVPDMCKSYLIAEIDAHGHEYSKLRQLIYQIPDSNDQGSIEIPTRLKNDLFCAFINPPSPGDTYFVNILLVIADALKDVVVVKKMINNFYKNITPECLAESFVVETEPRKPRLSRKRLKEITKKFIK